MPNERKTVDAAIIILPHNIAPSRESELMNDFAIQTPTKAALFPCAKWGKRRHKHSHTTYTRRKQNVNSEKKKFSAAINKFPTAALDCLRRLRRKIFN
jgi:hypothetical protein